MKEELINISTKEPSKKAWMVRAGNNNEIIEEVEEKSLVAIGWHELGNLNDINSRKEVKEKYKEVYPNDGERKKNTNAGQLFRFAHKIQKGDIVLTYDKSAREYLIGEVKSDYTYEPGAIKNKDTKYPHIREVDWKRKNYSRDNFSTAFKNALASSLTVFSLTKYLSEIKKALSGQKAVEREKEEEEGTPYDEEVKDQSRELISDKISTMDYRKFEKLVAAVLEAIGFQARVTEKGSDRGVDVIAHPDELGFERPLIKAQVKRQKNNVGGPDMRNFTATLNEGEKGLFVTTSDFTSKAKNEADKAKQRVRLLNREEFIELLLDNYGDLDAESKKLLRLSKVYIPSDEYVTPEE